MDSRLMGQLLDLGLEKRTILVQGFVRSKDDDRQSSGIHWYAMDESKEAHTLFWQLCSTVG